MKLLIAILILSCAFTYEIKAGHFPKPGKAVNRLPKEAALPPEKRKPGSPLDHLPANIEILTHFGERADFSPDDQRIAFMAKSFGDAMVLDIKTRQIRCLTCNVPGATFLRVMPLYRRLHIDRTRKI